MNEYTVLGVRPVKVTGLVADVAGVVAEPFTVNEYELAPDPAVHAALNDVAVINEITIDVGAPGDVTADTVIEYGPPGGPYK
jgi:hypothetical protein